ncbi:MAG: HU family DNA-binding protein [Bacteroidaceae bacterium]|nr:HU family DNA-binding protein [Bacteroidaceae bacterium]
MNEKVSFQNISDALSQRAGVSKKVADSFTKAFFDTIVDALYGGEEAIKVKGLGIFKLVSVESRESVNVTNGERIVIPGYKKVSFTPDDAVVELLNRKNETDEDGGNDECDDAKEGEVEALIQVEEPVQVEVPRDEFGGIDMLISTPESVEDVRRQYEEAKVQMEVAVEEARKANRNKLQLEKLLARLEANVQPEQMTRGTEHESVGMEDGQGEDEQQQDLPTMVHQEMEPQERADGQESGQGMEDERRQEAFNRLMKEETKVEPQKKQGNKLFWLIAVLLLLFAAIVYFLYRTSRNIEKVEKVPSVEQPVAKPVKPVPKPKKDSLKVVQLGDTAKAVAADSVKVAEVNKENTEKKGSQKKEAAQNPTRPTTHKMQRGESLTRISQKYYGTKDSVRAIIRENHFSDPNNVPIGAVVKLP